MKSVGARELKNRLSEYLREVQSGEAILVTDRGDVVANGTSQRCPCGAPNPKRLNDREHVCVECGLVITRDHASALEILRLGLSLLALAQPEVRVIVA